MKGMREIRRRIKSVKSTGQITRAMQLVASSKMKKSQTRAEDGRAYTLLLMDLIDILVPLISEKYRELSGEKRESNRRLVIVFSTERGLCGSLNANLFKAILNLEGDCSFIAVGAKAARFLSSTGRKLVAQFKVSDFVSFSEIKPIVDFAIQEFRENRADTIEVLYSLYVNTIKQEPTLAKIAPMEDLDDAIEGLRQKYKSQLAERAKDGRPICIEPSANELMRELPLYYLRNIVYHMALDAKASEQSARMVAMKAASDNAESLISELTLEYNKARQSAITTEITEIAAAAAAKQK
ncbi:MAG: ATP synthase F1 subunit gamma [Opitutales bacterium]|nr:ATP synthase F1 subunit gamma [Opitutales bacterium]